MTDFNSYLHPKDRLGRWRDALRRATGPDPLGHAAASDLLRGPQKRTGDVPAAEVAALRHLRPGQTLTLPHGTRVTRHATDLAGPRDFHTRVDPSTVASRAGAENAAALGVPDAPMATMKQLDDLAWKDRHVEMSPGRALAAGDRVRDPEGYEGEVEFATNNEPVNYLVRWDGDTTSYHPASVLTRIPPGRSAPPAGEASPGRVTPHNASLGREYADAEHQHREAQHGRGDLAAARARRDAAARAIDASMMRNSNPEASPGRVPLPPLDALSHSLARKLPATASRSDVEALVEREAGLLDPASRRALAAKVAERLDPAHPRATIVRPDELGRLNSPGRTRPRTEIEMTRGDAGKVADAIGDLKMYGDRPIPARSFFDETSRAGAPDERVRMTVGDQTLGVARDAVADTNRGDRSPELIGRLRRALDSGRQERSPGRAKPEPPFPEGGVSIISGGHRMGSYGSWEQAADQLLRERERGSTSARAVTGLDSRGELDAAQADYLVQLAASRAMAAREARLRDREEIAELARRL